MNEHYEEGKRLWEEAERVSRQIAMNLNRTRINAVDDSMDKMLAANMKRLQKEAEERQLQDFYYNSIGSSTETETAPKDKTNKPSWHIFPFEELEEVRKVFEHGVKKYGAPFTYRQGSGVPQLDLWDATLRHLLQIQKGEDCATDSLLLHWGHIAANALMAIATFNKTKTKT